MSTSHAVENRINKTNKNVKISSCSNIFGNCLNVTIFVLILVLLLPQWGKSIQLFSDQSTIQTRYQEDATTFDYDGFELKAKSLREAEREKLKRELEARRDDALILNNLDEARHYVKLLIFCIK